MQTTGDQAVPLTSANHKCAFAFTPEADFALSSLSVYKNAVADADAALAMSIHEDDGMATEPDGLFNGSLTNIMQGAASASSETVGFEASKGIGGSTNEDNGWRSAAVPTAGSPQDYIIDFGEGASLAINKVQIFSFNNANADIRAYPKDLEIAFDQNDNNWQTVITAFGQKDPGPARATQFQGVNGTGYRRMRIRITDRNGANEYCSIGEVKVFAAQAKPVPGTLLRSLGSKSAGTGSGWLRHTFEGFQLQRGKRYWILFSGQEGKSFSLSSRRWNTNEGSLFPDSVYVADDDVALKTTSDGGSAWTANLQDDKPAMLNVVLNSTPNHCPQLHYGRKSGGYVYLPTAGLTTIPEQAAVLSLEDKSADETLNVWFHQDGTLSADTERRVVTEGIEVKNGAPTSRFVGIVHPVERQPGLQGPIDVEDMRLVRNACQDAVPVGKRCPYGASDFTLQGFGGVCWQEMGAASPDDYKVSLLALPGDRLTMSIAGLVVLPPSYPYYDPAYITLGLNGNPSGVLEDFEPGFMSVDGATMSFFYRGLSRREMKEGRHTITPMLLCLPVSGEGIMIMYRSTAGDAPWLNGSASIRGVLRRAG
jgi:hypothetical protein